MSHLAARLIADAFADSDEGVNSILGEMTGVLFTGDALPDESISVYNELDHGWVSRGMVPDVDDSSTTVAFPMIVVRCDGVQYESGVPTIQSSGAHTIGGTVSLSAQLILRDNETVNAAVAGLYILRAMRGVITRYDDPDNLSDRTVEGIQLTMCTSISQGKLDAKLGETLVSPGALLLSYDFIETVPLPLSLH